MIDFMIRYGSLVIELNKLLGMRFINGNVSSKSLIGQSLKRIIEYHNQGEYLRRDYEFSKMTMLVKHLKEIAKYDINLLNAFKKQIHRSGTRDKYFGVRFKINIAASLIRKNIKFTKSEFPDFTIHKENKNIFIECGSAHLSKPKLGDIKYKIRSVINKKSSKPYCDPITSLFIDITNIYYNSLINEILLERDEIREYVKNVLEHTQVGNVTLFIYILNKDLNRFESVYTRIDNKNIDETLLNFLNECYPLGEHTVYKFAIPSEG